jgi:MFS family permease
MFVMVVRFLLSPLLPEIILDLGISSGQAGLALTLMWGLGALSQFPGGRIADDTSRKAVLAGALLLSMVGAALLTVATNYPLFIVGVAFIGVAGGLYPPAATLKISDLFEARRGQALGVNISMINVGGIVAAGIASAVLLWSTWRSAFLPPLAGLVLVLALLLRWLRGPLGLRRVEPRLAETARRLVRADRIRLLLVAATLFAFTWQGVINFLPTFLEVEKGFDPGVARAVFAGMFLVTAVANPLSGRVGDRYGYLAVAIAAAGVCGVGVLAMILSAGIPVLLGGVALFAVGTAAFWPVLGAEFMGVLSGDSRGGDYGAIRGVYIGLGSFGSAYTGLVAEFGRYSDAFAGLVVCLVLCIAVLWVRRGATR